MDAILLSNTHAVRFWSTTGDKHGRMFADAGNFLNIVPNPAGLVIKNPETLATELLIEPSDGSVNLQGGGTIKFASSLSSSSASAGGATALPSAPAGYVTMSVGGTNRKFPFYA